MDKRADNWAFGVLLFEMLSGRRPFAGATLTDVLAAVVTAEPDWGLLPAGTPPSLVRPWFAGACRRTCVTGCATSATPVIEIDALIGGAASDSGATVAATELQRRRRRVGGRPRRLSAPRRPGSPSGS